MPFVNCVLAMCDGKECKSREVVPLLHGPQGPGAALPEGWKANTSILTPEQRMLCPTCQLQKPNNGD